MVATSDEASRCERRARRASVVAKVSLVAAALAPFSAPVVSFFWGLAFMLFLAAAAVAGIVWAQQRERARFLRSLA